MDEGGGGEAEEASRRKAYPTCKISKPSLTSWGRSLTSLRFCAGSSTVLTPARRAPMSFSLIPPTAVTRPRRDISPCVTCHVSYTIQCCWGFGRGEGENFLHGMTWKSQARRTEKRTVMAIVGGTGLPENSEMRAMAWPMPLLGPSLGIAPEGQ